MLFEFGFHAFWFRFAGPTILGLRTPIEEAERWEIGPFRARPW